MVVPHWRQRVWAPLWRWDQSDPKLALHSSGGLRVLGGRPQEALNLCAGASLSGPDGPGLGPGAVGPAGPGGGGPAGAR
jgi:hypothetical protein